MFCVLVSLALLWAPALCGELTIFPLRAYLILVVVVVEIKLPAVKDCHTVMTIAALCVAAEILCWHNVMMISYFSL